MAAAALVGPRLQGAQLRGELRRLLGEYGPPDGLAEVLAASASGEDLAELLLPCLAAPVADEAEARAGAGGGGQGFTELEALTAIVRILGSEAGDLSGDTLAPSGDPMDRRELAAVSGRASLALRSEALVLAVLGLLRRRAQEFESGEEPFLRLEALRALRLQLLAMPGGAGRRWWVEETIGPYTHGETRRSLVEVLARALADVGQTLSCRPKTAALGALWSLVAGSPECRNHFLLTGGAAIVRDALHTQVMLPPPPVEATLIAACGLLGALVKGPRANVRRLADLRLEADVVELLRRCRLHREVVAAGFRLLGALACEEALAARLAASSDTAETIAAARARWPEDAEKALNEALRTAPQQPRDAALAVLSGAPDAVARSKAANLRSLGRIPPV